jgi:signal transduction histidine kinase
LRSIGRQLSLGLIGTLVLVGLLIGQVALWLFDSALRTASARELALAAERVLAAIERGGEGPQLQPTRLDATYRRPFSGHYFVVTFDDQVWRSRSLWDAELPRPPAPGLAPGLAAGPSGQQLLLLRADYRRYGRDFVVVVASDHAPAVAEFRRIIQWLLALWGAALALLLLLQRWWVARALRPLEQARRQIEQLQGGELPRLDEDAPVELLPLVREINRLLDHTQLALARSRKALGNLGHALKTPLAVLGNLAERDGVRADADLHAQLNEQIGVMRARIGRELNLARTAGEALPGHGFEPQADLPLLLQGVRLAHNRELAIDSEITVAGALPFEREDMLELLGNLLDNACKWARRHVCIRLERIADQLSVTVEDDGPGIDEGAREQVLERGIRLDERIDGHGLGLAIVGDIVQIYGGDIALQRAGLGGLRVTVTLPWPRPLS